MKLVNIHAIANLTANRSNRGKRSLKRRGAKLSASSALKSTALGTLLFKLPSNAFDRLYFRCG
ncbi:hypothetical protein HanPI659440_Chr05g0203911 [Helianthus annuus]|nr:hypothetical protein HanPI659440_Chr05g0203911 [Helianthus annuus]